VLARLGLHEETSLTEALQNSINAQRSTLARMRADQNRRLVQYAESKYQLFNPEWSLLTDQKQLACERSRI
jgi:hypothetical protein